MCIKSVEQLEEDKRNKEIERRLKELKNETRRQVKLLLLGTGESGKSTFTKQMRIIHDNGFSKSELENKRVFVFHNTVQCMQLILQAMEFLNISLDRVENKEAAKIILNVDCSYAKAPEIFNKTHLLEEYVTSIENLWLDNGLKICFDRRNEYQLSDSAEYFFANVRRFGKTDYIPNNADIVRIRVPTTGINEHLMCIKNVNLRIVDVGGQDNERLKWINCFEGVTSIIFITALNEYDMYKYKRTGTFNDSAYDQMAQFLGGKNSHRENRMAESLSLFKIITSLKILANASFILFLNKTDLLEKKIEKSPLKKTFSEYDGPSNDPIKAREFIKEKFAQHAYANIVNDQTNPLETKQNRVENARKSIYAHFTCATDTGNIKRVFDSVKHTILNNNIIEVLPYLN